MQKIPSTGTASLPTMNRVNRHSSRNLNNIEMHGGINKHMMGERRTEEGGSERDWKTGVDVLNIHQDQTTSLEDDTRRAGCLGACRLDLKRDLGRFVEALSNSAILHGRAFWPCISGDSPKAQNLTYPDT